MEIFGEIKGIKYKPFLCKTLQYYNLNELEKALSQKGSFILKITPQSEIAISWWVSPKRTRSYPYARVYDTLNFPGKKVTIIPIIKDEGKKGDRDFIQWDTISLMSLLGVYVIIGYYVKAERSDNYKNKITRHKFDIDYILSNIEMLLNYQSDALHWNLEQANRVSEIFDLAIRAYEKISKDLNIELHTTEIKNTSLEKFKEDRESFIKISRTLARKAQQRESIIKQPKERISNSKAMITIKNYLGGYYFLTCDEIEIHNNKIYLIEAKHTSRGYLSSEGDVKDGLIKMILFTNLSTVNLENQTFLPIPVLKLTNNYSININELKLSNKKIKFLELLIEEAKYNNFRIKLNNTFIV